MDLIQSFITSKGSATVGGISFYYSEGKLQMRQASGPSGKQIKTKASCAGIRKNNTEFACASQLGRSMRIRIGLVLKHFADSQISGRLTGLFRTVIKHGDGIPGQREFNPYLHRELLHGFECNRHTIFHDVWKPDITCTRSKDTHDYIFQMDVNPAKDITAPAGATHARFTLISLAIPVIGYDADRKKYVQENARSIHASFKQKAAIDFKVFPLGVEDTVSHTLHINGLPDDIESGSGVMVCLYGVSFYTGDTLMREGAVMKVGEVVW